MKSLPPYFEFIHGTRVKVYDNHGETFERFAVLLMDCPNGLGSYECIRMSPAPSASEGFRSHYTPPGKHLGKRMLFSELPEICRRTVLPKLMTLGSCRNKPTREELLLRQAGWGKDEFKSASEILAFLERLPPGTHRFILLALAYGVTRCQLRFHYGFSPNQIYRARAKARPHLRHTAVL